MKKHSKKLSACVFVLMLILASLAAFTTQTASATPSGDLNNDGVINMSDVIQLAKTFNSVTGDGKYIASYDLNSDGAINMSDVIIIASKFNTSVANTNTPIPTPTTKPPTPTVAPTSAANKWVGTWGTAPQLVEQNNMPPSPGLSNNTLRQVFRVSIGGNQVRFKFSNQYGNSPLVMNSVHLAVSAGSDSIKSDTDKVIKFSGKEAVTIPAGQTVTSDPLDFDLPKLTNMAVTIYFGSVPSALTGHPGSRTTSYILTGNKVTSASMASSVKTEHWYVITGLDVLTEDSYKAVVALGDSITDGRGSTTDKQNRWTDNFADRLLANSATSKVAVLNQGIGGNTVLSGGLGPTATTRFDRDVLEQSGVRYLILFEGVNDIGSASSTQTATNLINTYKQFITKAHAKNILVYGATITPIGGSQYDSAIHEQVRKTVNDWIRTSGQFDAVMDFDAAVRNPNDQSKLLNTYDSGDHLHLNPEGYKKLAEVMDLTLFTK
ncbi:MAG TPA: GDSL-type esterase/lipase family protein [Pseudobacteroides sp.]|uniref:GDSL-type esterase/lipase family protein n=1 Tax=Pseudobacteroides sp. TaxID=1968840 RepID=UPI002F93B689